MGKTMLDRAIQTTKDHRRHQDEVVTSQRWPGDLYDKMRETAEKNGISITRLAIAVLREAFSEK